MKKLNRFISLTIVCVLLITTTTSVAFGEQIYVERYRTLVGNEFVQDDMYKVIHIDSKEANDILLGYKEDDNKIEFIQIENGIITSQATFNRSKNIINCADICDNKVIFSTIDIAQYNNVTNSLFQAKGYSSIGGITYRYYDQGYPSGTRRIALSLSETGYPNSRYNINGKYQSVTGIASLIAALFTVPGVVASAVAIKVLTILSISAGAGSILIPDYYVRASEIENKWKLTSFGTTAYMRGSKFIFKHEYNGSTQTEYEGDYYTRSSYTNHNATFANKICSHMPLYWGGDGIVEVVSWG